MSQEEAELLRRDREQLSYDDIKRRQEIRMKYGLCKIEQYAAPPGARLPTPRFELRWLKVTLGTSPFVQMNRKENSRAESMVAVSDLVGFKV